MTASPAIPLRGARAAAFAGLCALALVSVLACRKAGPTAGAEAAARSWPAGTVLVMNEVPILAEEIDRIGSDFALIEPEDTPTQLRRLSIARSIVPSIAAQSIDPQRRASARELAESYRAACLVDSLPAGPMTGPTETEISGDFNDLGFALWRTALPLQPGAWSEIVETAGCFHLLRIKSREEGSLPSRTRFTIGLFNFPYLDAETARADIEAAIDRSRLIILDETWRDAVPASLRYRLHAENP